MKYCVDSLQLSVIFTLVCFTIKSSKSETCRDPSRPEIVEECEYGCCGIGLYYSCCNIAVVVIALLFAVILFTTIIILVICCAIKKFKKPRRLVNSELSNNHQDVTAIGIGTDLTARCSPPPPYAGVGNLPPMYRSYSPPPAYQESSSASRNLPAVS